MLAQYAMTTLTARVIAGHDRSITSESGVTPLFIQYKLARDSGFAIAYGCFSRIKNMLGRTETRTRDRMYCQTIRTARDISRDNRARIIIVTCRLRTPTALRRIIVLMTQLHAMNGSETGRLLRHAWSPPTRRT